jgi:hypothetical protein
LPIDLLLGGSGGRVATSIARALAIRVVVDLFPDVVVVVGVSVDADVVGCDGCVDVIAAGGMDADADVDDFDAAAARFVDGDDVHVGYQCAQGEESEDVVVNVGDFGDAQVDDLAVNFGN